MSASTIYKVIATENVQLFGHAEHLVNVRIEGVEEDTLVGVVQLTNTDLKKRTTLVAKMLITGRQY